MGILVGKFKIQYQGVNHECDLDHAGDDLPGVEWRVRLFNVSRAGAFSDAAILQGNRRLDEKPAREFRLYQELGKIRVSYVCTIRWPNDA